MKNKYILRSRISAAKFRQTLRLFCLDIEACKVAQIAGINHPEANRLFHHIRQHIAHECERASPFGEGAVELDERYFGPRRVRGRRGRGAAGKTPVFGMFKRGGKAKWLKTALWLKSCRLTRARPVSRWRFIAMDLEPETVSPTSAISNITASDTATTSSRKVAAISTASGTSGGFARCALPAFGVFTYRGFIAT